MSTTFTLQNIPKNNKSVPVLKMLRALRTAVSSFFKDSDKTSFWSHSVTSISAIRYSLRYGKIQLPSLWM